MPRALLAAILAILAGPAPAAEAGLSFEVPAGQTKSIRLRNLPQGAVVAVRIVASGRALVALVGARQLKSPGGRAKAVFRGTVERRLTFRVVIPETDHYYLVLNNRGGAKAVNIEASIRADRGRTRPAPKPYSPRPEKASWSPR